MKTLLKTLLVSASIATLTCINATAQTIVIKAKNVVTNTSLGQVDGGTLLIENGKITSLGTNANFQGDTTISGTNYWVTPGIFAGFSSLGLVEVSAVGPSNDVSAGNADAGLSLRASDSFNPKASSVGVSRVGGVTHAAIAPGSGNTIFGGIGMVATTDGGFDSARDGRFIFAQLGQGGAGTAGGSRSASVGYLRSALEDAANINTRYTNNSDHGDVLNRYEASLLSEALRGKTPLVISVDRAADILKVIDLKRNRLNIIIVGAAEGWMVADQLAAAGVPVIMDPVENLPYSFDRLGSRLDNAKLLQDAGVDVAYMTRAATGGTTHNVRLLTQNAGNAVANGVSWADAFKSITLTPASLYGFSELGTLQAGQTANLVVWDGDPLNGTSAPVAVFIDGKQQSMVSRQSILRDRYHPTKPNKPAYGYGP